MLPDPRAGAGVPSRITGFHQDERGDWVADLACGHAQHVRHDPPWQNRPWILSPGGRTRFIGATLQCLKCAGAGGGGA